jgi:hypothetical protein
MEITLVGDKNFALVPPSWVCARVWLAQTFKSFGPCVQNEGHSVQLRGISFCHMAEKLRRQPELGVSLRVAKVLQRLM